MFRVSAQRSPHHLGSFRGAGGKPVPIERAGNGAAGDRGGHCGRAEAPAAKFDVSIGKGDVAAEFVTGRWIINPFGAGEAHGQAAVVDAAVILLDEEPGVCRAGDLRNGCESSPQGVAPMSVVVIKPRAVNGKGGCSVM